MEYSRCIFTVVDKNKQVIGRTYIIPKNVRYIEEPKDMKGYTVVSDEFGHVSILQHSIEDVVDCLC